MMDVYSADRSRGYEPPLFLKWLRKLQQDHSNLKSPIYRLFNKFFQFLYHCEISPLANIGSGLYIGHPFGITINPNAVIGSNCNIHKGLTIGQENRGHRKGAPVIGNDVWIGVNATIVGNIKIGNDVLIAPNTYVNCDIPSHSVVFGNPCIIK